MTEVFPFRAYHSTETRRLYLKHRPEKETWYEVDIEVTSRTTATFIVFDMCDSINSFELELPASELKGLIQNRIQKLAEWRWEEAQERQRRNEIDAIAAEILKSI